MQDSNDDKERKNAYADTLLKAWIENRMERDRTIVALSAGGLGLLTTLITAFGVATCLGLVTYVVATVAYLLSIVAGILIFPTNADYLQREWKAFHAEQPAKGSDPALRFLDRTLLMGFLMGVLLTVGVAVVSAVDKMGDSSMNSGADKSRIGQAVIKKSLDQIGQMRPIVVGNSQVNKPSDGAKPSSESANAPVAPNGQANVTPTSQDK